MPKLLCHLLFHFLITNGRFIHFVIYDFQITLKIHCHVYQGFPFIKILSKLFPPFFDYLLQCLETFRFKSQDCRVFQN